MKKVYISFWENKIRGIYKKCDKAHAEHIKMIKKQLEPLTFSDIRRKISPAIDEEEESTMKYLRSGEDMKYYFKYDLTYEDYEYLFVDNFTFIEEFNIE